jgi:hypothetical protein
MAAKCTRWTKTQYSSGFQQFVSRCAGGVVLEARPEDWRHPNGPTDYIVKYNGSTVRHGHAKTMAAARAAARRQAGATSGLSGWWPFSKKKKASDRDPRPMAQTVMYARGKDGSLIPLRGARRRRRRRR